MDNIWVWVLVGVVVLVVILIRNYLLRKTYTKKIMKAMSEEDYDRFYHILDSFWCKFALHPADREMMRLSAVLSQGDTAKIEDQINLMLHMRMKKKRKAAVAMQGFYFYVEMKNRRKADKMISIVQENAGPQSAKELKMIASVLLRKEAKYIHEMQAYYDNAVADEQKGMFAYLLGLEYKYKNDTRKSKKYLKEALQKLKGTPYEEEIRSLLSESAE